MILENVKLNWSRLGDNPGTKYMSDELEWSLDAVLSDEQAEEWVASGVKPALKVKDGVKFVKLRKDTVWKKSGDPKKSPIVVNKFNEPIDPTTIGNGTTANVQVTIRDWEYSGKKGKSAELVAVQVLELVEFTGSGAEGVAFSFQERDVVPLADVGHTDDVPF